MDFEPYSLVANVAKSKRSLASGALQKIRVSHGLTPNRHHPTGPVLLAISPATCCECACW